MKASHRKCHTGSVTPEVTQRKRHTGSVTRKCHTGSVTPEVTHGNVTPEMSHRKCHAFASGLQMNGRCGESGSAPNALCVRCSLVFTSHQEVSCCLRGDPGTSCTLGALFQMHVGSTQALAQRRLQCDPDLTERSATHVVSCTNLAADVMSNFNGPRRATCCFCTSPLSVRHDQHTFLPCYQVQMHLQTCHVTLRSA